jgi:mannose/fructose/N-acetylgalactosamine-specific phosphotransferase system component IIC
VFKYLAIGATGGNISIDDVGGGVTAAVFPVSAGQAWDIVRVKRVRATGTTATPIYGVS